MVYLLILHVLFSWLLLGRSSSREVHCFRGAQQNTRYFFHWEVFASCMISLSQQTKKNIKFIILPGEFMYKCSNLQWQRFYRVQDPQVSKILLCCSSLGKSCWDWFLHCEILLFKVLPFLNALKTFIMCFLPYRSYWDHCLEAGC